MKVIDLLNKIANGELENGTRFRDKYTQKEYIFKPNSYAGIYPPDTSKSDEDWLLTLHSGWFRLDQEVEIIEEDKKIEKIKILNCDGYVKKENYETILTMQEIALDIQTLRHKLDEIIDYLEENK